MSNKPTGAIQNERKHGDNFDILPRLNNKGWATKLKNRLAEQQGEIERLTQLNVDAASLHLADEQSIRNMQAEIDRLRALLLQIEDYPEKYLSDTEMAPDSQFRRGAITGLRCAAEIAAKARGKE